MDKYILGVVVLMAAFGASAQEAVGKFAIICNRHVEFTRINKAPTDIEPLMLLVDESNNSLTYPNSRTAGGNIVIAADHISFDVSANGKLFKYRINRLTGTLNMVDYDAKGEDYLSVTGTCEKKESIIPKF